MQHGLKHAVHQRAIHCLLVQRVLGSRVSDGAAGRVELRTPRYLSVSNARLRQGAVLVMQVMFTSESGWWINKLFCGPMRLCVCQWRKRSRETPSTYLTVIAIVKLANDVHKVIGCKLQLDPLALEREESNDSSIFISRRNTLQLEKTKKKKLSFSSNRSSMSHHVCVDSQYTQTTDVLGRASGEAHGGERGVKSRHRQVMSLSVRTAQKGEQRECNGQRRTLSGSSRAGGCGLSICRVRG